jgi:hypothetical protein
MFEADDCVAVFLKAYDTGQTCQRVAPVAVLTEPRWQTWLRVMNAHRFNVYVSVNAVTPWRRARTKEAVHAVRHVFLDADHGGPDILRRLERWHDLPRPSSVLRTSPGRVQVLWRVHGFSPECVERLQKQLARELGTDLAATACTQTMRIPGFLNWKYAPPVVVTGEYGDARTVFEPSDFPIPVDPHSATGDEPAPLQTGRTNGGRSPLTPPDVIERARRYMAAVPAAVSGQRGDVRTFQVCCRLARGFGLAPGDALNLLAEWNARCNPPWTERELLAKLDHAKRYGREPIGGLLTGGV